jgi:hypothetical protein
MQLNTQAPAVPAVPDAVRHALHVLWELLGETDRILQQRPERAAKVRQAASGLEALFEAAPQPEAAAPACKGTNCSAVRGVGHSQECEAEHDMATSALDTAGNRNPEARYAGYKGQPALPAYTADQLAAWQEGTAARTSAKAPQPEVADEAVRKDAQRLDFLDSTHGKHVVELGGRWYTRANYGMPIKKRKNLRDAIDAAKAAQGGV